MKEVYEVTTGNERDIKDYSHLIIILGHFSNQNDEWCLSCLHVSLFQYARHGDAVFGNSVENQHHAADPRANRQDRFFPILLVVVFEASLLHRKQLHVPHPRLPLYNYHTASQQ